MVSTTIMNASKRKFSCIILAAGKSERFEKNKLFIPTGKGPLLFVVIDLVLSFGLVNEIVVVVSSSDFDRVKRKYSRNQKVGVILGGKNRMESTCRGLRVVESKGYTYVYVHDSVRPIFSKTDFLRLKKEIVSKNLDGVVQYVKIYDSVMGFEGNIENARYLDKNNIVQLKTPHIYKVDSILESLIKYTSHGRERENVEVLSSFGGKIGFIEGSVGNIKITYKNDMRVIKKLL